MECISQSIALQEHHQAPTSLPVINIKCTMVLCWCKRWRQTDVTNGERAIGLACRLAGRPTSRSPLSVNAITEGVVRAPSAFSMTRGVCRHNVTVRCSESIERFFEVVSIPLCSVCRHDTICSSCRYHGHLEAFKFLQNVRVCKGS